MMGGMMVNITGPCFNPDRRIICRFDTQDVVGKYIDANRAVCIMPRVYATGYVDLTLSIDGGNFNWKGRFYVGKSLNYSVDFIYFNRRALIHDDISCFCFLA